MGQEYKQYILDICKDRNDLLRETVQEKLRKVHLYATFQASITQCGQTC